MLVRMIPRSDTAANWTATNPVLALNEHGWESDTKKLKIGNGVTAWASLPYVALGGGDITVKKAGSTVGTRPGIHVTDGADITTTITDDAANNEVDITIGITAGAFASIFQQGSEPTGADAVANNIWIKTTDPRRPVYRHDGIAWRELSLAVERIGVALSDETTAITTGTAKTTIHMPFGMTLTEVRAEVNTPSTSGLVTVDINEGAGAGVSILSTKLTIDANEETSTTAATPPVISDAILADNARITFDIDTAGTGAKGLKVWLIGYRTT